MSKKYYIQIGDNPEREVSRSDYIQLEFSCGFKPKIKGQTATNAFQKGIIKGWQVLNE